MMRKPPTWSLFFGTALFAFLFWSAWRFYLERTAIADSAFMSFMMLDVKHPVSFLERYGSWLPQLLPLSLIYLGASLEAVLRTYSLMFVLVHFAAFLLLTFKWKDHVAALVLLISLCAGHHYTFYYGISELQQGLTFVILAWAMLRKWLDATDQKAARWYAIGMALFTLWAAIDHQLLVCPALFLSGYEVIVRRAWSRRSAWIAVALVIGIYVLRGAVLSSSTYEQERVPTLHDVRDGLAHLGQLASTEYFSHHWTLYKAIWLLMLTQAIIAWRQRRWLPLAWSWSAGVALVVLILIADRDQGSPRIFEDYIPLLGVLLSVDLSRAVLQIDDTRRWQIGWRATTATVLLLGCVQVYRGHFMASAHVRWAQRITAQLNERGTEKALIHVNAFPWAYSWEMWQAPFETALISGVNGPRHATTVFVTDLKETPIPKSNKRYVFLGPDWEPTWFTTNHFSRPHFKFLPGNYVRVSSLARDTAQIQRTIEQLVVHPVMEAVHMVPDRFTVAEVELENPTNDTLHALLPDGEPLRLAYRLLDADGRPCYTSDQRTAIEMDVLPHGKILTGIAFERPLVAGTYTAEVSVAAGPGEWPTKARVKLTVGAFGL